MTADQALGSRYVIEERISSGGMGEIWRGRDLAADEPVAIKVLHERFAADPTELTRFVRERTILTGLRHPNLVPVRDMIMEGGRLALVMDLVEGPDMHRHLRTHGPLAPAPAATLIAQVCEALAVVHAAGIVHRDLKPSNILLDTSQSPPIARLTDFGIARAEDALPLTTESVIVGTPQYCAPEVIGGERGGPSVDVYAAGTSLYELLVGRPPFAGGPASAVFWRHLDAEPLRPPGTPESLWAVIAACLAKDPARRPSAETTARLLRDCLPALPDAPAAAAFPVGSPRFRLSQSTAGGEDELPSQTPGPEPYAPAAPTTVTPRVRPADVGPAPSRRWRQRTKLLTRTVSLTAVAGVTVAAWLMSQRDHAAPHLSAGSHTSATRVPAQATQQPAMGGLPAGRPVQRTKHVSPTGQAGQTPRGRATSHAPAPHPVHTASAVPPAAFTPTRSTAAQAPPAPAVSSAPVSPTPTPQAASILLYSFEDGTADGWQAGANVGSVTAVTSFQDGPGHPYDGNYALDAAPANGADIPVPRTMSVTPASPLNLSAAQDFFLWVDGFGYAPYATGYTVKITLASGNVEVIGSASVQPNAWTKLVIPVSTWSGRSNITSISVSYAGVGSNTPWFPHFQIDDVGYLT